LSRTALIDRKEDKDKEAENDTMKTLNRSIAILKPKQPYIDWINSTAPEEELLISKLNRRSFPDYFNRLGGFSE
jgi:hypothetical protein